MKNNPYSQQNNAFWYVVVDRYGKYKIVPEGTVLKNMRVVYIGPPFSYSEASQHANQLNQISEVMES